MEGGKGEGGGDARGSLHTNGHRFFRARNWARVMETRQDGATSLLRGFCLFW